MARLSIGALSRATGVKVTTIRYYESTGVLSPPARSESGRRHYGADDVARLGFVRHARELGFPMSAIKALADLESDPSQDCAEVDAIAREQLEAVRQRLSALRALETELERMIDGCRGGRVEACRVMATLRDHHECADGEHRRVEPL